MSNQIDISNSNFSSDEAQINHQAIIELKEMLTEGFLLLAEKLYFCQQKELYKELGYETFEEYIAIPELGFKRAWVYELLRIYRVYIEKYNIDKDILKKIGVTKLALLTSVVDDNNYDDWLSKANTLSVSDLLKERLEYRQKIGKGVVEEIILQLSSKQIVSLFFSLVGEDLSKYDKLYKKILKYKEFQLIRDIVAGEIWKGIEF